MTVEIIPEKKLSRPSTTCLNNIKNGRDNLEYLLDLHKEVEMAIIIWFKDAKMKQFPMIPSIRKINFDMAKKTLLSLHNSDEYDVDTILYVLDYVISDNFWKDKILSITPLRNKKKGEELTKFDNIVPKVKILASIYEEKLNDSGENGVVFKAFEY